MSAVNSLYYGLAAWKELEDVHRHYNKIFILCDGNTQQFCLPLLNDKCSVISNAQLLTTPQGDQGKSLESCQSLWKHLLDSGATRHDLLINLGGGVVSDIGGFVASSFKRGMHFINVPTTLLAMVDAGIGGKTGINFSGVKNVIGSFAFPDKVLIDTEFLRTLPKGELKNGWAETIKHALIADRDLWNDLKENDFEGCPQESLIYRSSELKLSVVSEDPYEMGLRKLLNFGHTIGHAIEALMLQKGSPLGHGLAVAAGMVIETMLSTAIGMLPADKEKEITDFIIKLYRFPSVLKEDIDNILELMRYDKKNVGDKLLFTLLREPGKGVIDVAVDPKEIKKVLNRYIILCRQR